MILQTAIFVPMFLNPGPAYQVGNGLLFLGFVIINILILAKSIAFAIKMKQYSFLFTGFIPIINIILLWQENAFSGWTQKFGFWIYMMITLPVLFWIMLFTLMMS